jgi:voltage-gated potassium channel Kch
MPISAKYIFYNLSLVFIILSFGTLGYYFIEDGWSLNEAFYMAAITITTVGFGEIHPLSQEGRYFTILLILVGFGAVAYMGTQLARLVIDIELKRFLERKTMRRKILELKKHYIICGYGRMGHEVHDVLKKYNIETAVIDPHSSPGGNIDNYIPGRTNAHTLKRAGIKDASGIIAGTDDDGHNLGILLNARYFNPDLFTIVRQNRHQNEIAFDYANVDMIMQPSLVTARRILFLLVAPLLKPFFRYLLEEKPGRKLEMENLIQRLREAVGSRKPHIVTIDFIDGKTRSVMQWLNQGKDVFLGDLLKDPDNRDRDLDLVMFVIKSGDEVNVLPTADYKICTGDQLLVCGTELAIRLLNATINSEYKLFYIQNGVFLPRSYLAQWYVKKTNRIGV